MPPLKLTVDTLDDVPEETRSLYQEREGKFVLDVDGLPDVAGLQSALQAERKRAAELDKLAKRAKEIDLEEYQRLKAEQAEREKKAAEQRGEYDRVLKQKDEQLAQILKQKDEETSRIRRSLEQNLIDAEATRAVSAAKGIPELLMPHIRDRVRVVEEGGQYRVQVLTKTGAEAIGPKGDPMSIAELVEEMRADAIFARAFEPTGTRGSGAGSGSPGSGGGAPAGSLSATAIEGLSLAEYARLRREGKIA